MSEKTNEQINAESDQIRDKAKRDKADSSVIPNSGYDSRSVQNTTYWTTFNDS